MIVKSIIICWKALLGISDEKSVAVKTVTIMSIRYGMKILRAIAPPVEDESSLSI